MLITKVLSICVLTLAFTSLLCATPRLGLSTTTVGIINIPTGSNGPSQTVQAYNLGDGTLTLTTTSSAGWLSATVGAQTACSQASGGCYPISIALNTSALAGGMYTELLTVNSAGAVDAPQTISVTVNTTGVPNSITAYLTPTGGSAATNTFQIYTVDTQQIGVKGAVTTQSGGNWLQFLSGSDSLVPQPAPWIIAVNALGGMSPGTYTGTVTISGSSAASDNKTINVTCIVTASPIVGTASYSTVRLTGAAGGPSVASTVTLSNLATTTSLTVSSATPSAGFLNATVSSPTSIQISANPGSMAAGFYTGSVTISSNAANNSQVVIPVEFTVAPSGVPAIFMGGIVNAATGTSESVSQGDVVSIYGMQFATAGTLATNPSTPLATTLGGTQVLANGTPVPLYFVSPGQINFQMPYGATAGQNAAIQVVSGSTQGNIRSIGVSTIAPRLLFFVSFITGNYGVIVNNTDGSLTLPTGTVVPGFVCHPAKPGDVLTVYGIGFGQTNPIAVEGQAASATQLENVPGTMASFGGGIGANPINVIPSFSGLTPTAVGLYQVNVTVPSVPPFGSGVPLSVSVNNQSSNTVYLAISATGK